MAKLVLTRPDVAEKYECNVEKDIIVHTNGYSGKLSMVNMKGAASLVKSKTGYLTEKAAAKPAKENTPK